MPSKVQAGDTTGARLPRKTGRMNIPEMNPWMNAMYELLSDGQWHHRDDLIAVGADRVPPGRAYRYSERRRVRTGTRTTFTRTEERAAGQRQEASQAVLSSARWGGTVRDGEKFRMSDTALAAWAEAHAATTEQDPR
jgi:hypothetical protein